MQTSTSPREASGGYATRRGHVPHLSISDESHHVTEAIGYMYDDDYDNKRDSKRLSYITSPLGESISTSFHSTRALESPSSQQTQESAHGTSNGDQNHRKTNAHDARSSMSGSNSPADTATTSFPLNDIDYESNPAAVAQELSNLAAIRRMSMDLTATGDPDLPSFGSNLVMPSIAPSPSADENDTSRLFWVPARLHPELAPKEFKSFLESKAEQIKRRSGEFSSGSGSDLLGSGGSLRRKKSMLSRQIDNSSGYTDGAERLERKRSQAQKGKPDHPNPNLHDLEALVDDSKQLNKEAVSLLQGIQSLDMSDNEDKPILPPAPPGHSLRRSTRTQYRKASLKNGQRPPYSKRHASRASESSDVSAAATTTTSDDSPPIAGLTRTPTDPTPSSGKTLDHSKPARSTALPPGSTSSSNFETILEQPDSENRASAPPQTRQWHSRISSNGRSTLQVPPRSQKVPQIPEGSAQDENRAVPGSNSQQNYIPERTSSHDPPPTLPPQGPLPQEPISGKGSRRPSLTKQSVKESTQTIADVAANPSALPGHAPRTDSLSFIPTTTEDNNNNNNKKSESRKSKEKKESDGSRKSSWHWLLGNEEKEKEKDKKKDKDSDSKKVKSKRTESVEKMHDSTRLDVLQTSIDSGQRGRESLVLDRSEVKLDEERRKESARKSSGESKKDSGIFSSIFGSGKKRSSGEGHKKSSSRNYSPDPPVRELRPDIDYNWSRFSILEERAIYRMAHIKLANPRRALYSQVLLSNFMYSYLAKVQQMHPQMMLPTSPAQRQQKASSQQDAYSQYQSYQEVQEQQYGDVSYDESQMYDYETDDRHDRHRSQSRGSKHGYENNNMYGPGHQQYGHSSFGDDAQLDDDDDMW
ncbi:hypothetical protein VTN00DRAFT_4969 [Thermoascus crustaceus]|uniref:uncharacterized protein n=1 Tax=Thermoascus crustaceus TaxID=5088 RepID=UPI003742B146